MVESQVRTDPARPAIGSAALLAGLVCVIAAGAAGRGLSKPVWHDEIFTIYLSTRLSIAQLWSALAAGVDLNPPLYYLVVRAAWMLTGSETFASRIPSLVGFLLAVVMLFVFVRRRFGTLAGLAAAATPSLTGAAIYAFEGRPYGLMLGFSAAAITAWQARIEPRWRPLSPVMCAAALAAGVWTHYYFVLILLPLIAGEGVRTLRQRTVDLPMLIAFAAGMAPLLALLPQIQAARGFTSGFWSAPEAALLADFVQQLLLPVSLLALPVAASLAALRTFSSVPPIGSPPGEAVTHGFLVEEIATMLSLLALPFVGFGLALLVTGAFHGRYVLPAVLGVALAVGGIVGAALRSWGERAAAVAVMVAALALQQAGGVLAIVRDRPDPLGEDRSALAAAIAPLPVVATPALVYLPIAHYADAADRGRVVYLMKPDVIAATTPTTSDRALRALSGYVPLPVEDYDLFIDRYPAFYLYGRQTWLAPLLVKRGATLQLVGTFGDRTLYLVRSTPL
jgi:hypothetical protein